MASATARAAEGTAPSTGTGLAAEVDAVLRRADALEARAAGLRAAWEEERTRGELLLGGLGDEAAALRAEIARERAALAAVEERRRELSARRAAAAARRAAVAAAAARLQAGLDALAARLPPGAVAAAAEPSGEGAAVALRDALRRHRRTREALADIATGIAAVVVAGQTRSVETLRIGGAACWWRSLDGEQAGVLERRDGRKLARQLTGTQRTAILAAFAVAHQRVPARILVLPVAAAAGESSP